MLYFTNNFSKKTPMSVQLDHIDYQRLGSSFVRMFLVAFQEYLILQHLGLEEGRKSYLDKGQSLLGSDLLGPLRLFSFFELNSAREECELMNSD